jgi:hypothetical protein
MLLTKLKNFLLKRIYDRQNYLFWVIDDSIGDLEEEQKGIFIRGQRILLSDIPQILLLMLLASPNVQITYDALWNAVSPTDKHCKLIYKDDTKDRSRIFRWCQRLKNETKGILNLNWGKYITNKRRRRRVAGHNPGLFISGYTFKPCNEKFIYVYPADKYSL